MPSGSPFFETPEEMQAKIDQYFNEIADSEGNITITGLVLYLGFCSRQSFYDYENKEDFSYTVKRARTMIEQSYENKLHGTTPTGPIFALKNLGWQDTQAISLSEAVTPWDSIKSGEDG